MASRCCSSVLNPRLLGQLIFDTVATQAALNSDWDLWDDWDAWDWDGKDVWDWDWDAWDWDAGCCGASTALVVFLDDEHAFTRATSKQLVTNRDNLLNIVGSRLKNLPER